MGNVGWGMGLAESSLARGTYILRGCQWSLVVLGYSATVSFIWLGFELRSISSSIQQAVAHANECGPPLTTY